MPKQRQYEEGQAIEVQWVKDGQLVCVRAEDREGWALWQATSPDQIDQLVGDLRRAKRQAWRKPDPEAESPRQE